jgi:acetyltransferase
MKPPTTPNAEPAHDILRARQHPLDVFFEPETVAVIGATEKAGSVGRTMLWNLISNPFGGTVFPVNPKRPSVLGIKAYPSVASVPEKIDLAVVVTPASTVPGVISECADAGVKAAIIISAGFKECGEPGVRLEEQVLAEARRGRMRIIGPNCLGVMSPLAGLNATFASTMARPGNVGFISQSGALCTAVLDWSLKEFVGFSAFISVGSMLDVNWGDLIDYFGDDPHTRSIILYMESIGDPRAFLSAARQVALSKPIIVIKAGRTEAAAKAAASHTGALAGSDDVLEAAFRRSGVLRVDKISDVFYMAEVLAKQPRPRGPRLAIVTNAGGPGVLATDALIGEGGELAQLSQETLAALNGFLPPHWSRSNPVDVLGDADSGRYAKAVEQVAHDPGNDGLLVILAPQAMTDPTQTAEHLTSYAKLEGKPILASWMGGAQVAAGQAILNRAGIPNFPYPDTAVRVFHYMWRYSYNLRGLYETPSLVAAEGDVPNRDLAGRLIDTARRAGRSILTEFESKQLLQAYGIPTVETRAAAAEDEAVQAAGEIGYPVVVKLLSETITHKTDVGGVRLNLADESAVRRAYREIQSAVVERAGAGHFLGVTVQPMIKLDGYELIVGSTLDPQFGPVLLFGLGGQLVEVFHDRALALPPLNTTLARRMMEQTRIFTALEGVRGRRPVDLAALEGLLVRFSQLVVEQPRIKEIDINPLLASPERLVALDARVLVHPADVAEEQLPRLAIRPYPTRYVASWTTKDGATLTLRPIRPEDEPGMVEFHQRLSERSVYMRYFHMVSLGQRVAHERLTRICFIDYDREMALVAEHTDPSTGARAIVAVARLSRLGGTNDGDVAIVVIDQFQRRGLGSELLRRLIEIGRDEHLERITADILAENREMQRVCEKLGFHLERALGDPSIRGTIELVPQSSMQSR